MKIAFQSICLLAALAVVPAAEAAPKRALVVTTTTGFRHSSIETAEVVLAKVGVDSGVFTVEYARVTPPKVSRKPNTPKATGDAAKDAKATEKYEAELAKFTAEEPMVNEALKKYADEQKAVLGEKMSPAALKNYDQIAWVSLPGEIFVELGMAIKKASPFRYTIIAELANGSIGYIPDKTAYPQGNYEVVSARCAEGSGEILVESALRQLNALKGPALK